MCKIWYFILEGLNSFGTVYYSYYLFFFMEQVFGFGNQANLALAAVSGGIYMVASWWGGRFAQRFGYFRALKVGFVIMMAAQAAGTQLGSVGGQGAVMAGTGIGMCFTWRTLEALVSEGEGPAGLQRMVGIYNVVWAGAGALAYFTGGAMMERLGLKSLFYVPLVILAGQLGLTIWIERLVIADCRLPIANLDNRRRMISSAGSGNAGGAPGPGAGTAAPLPAPVGFRLEANPRPVAKAKTFLRLAWLANPLAYMTVNTLIAVMPSLAKRLELSTMLAGFCGSVWCFARLGTFFGLWFWTGWHYRFGWLLASYLALVSTFAAILLVPSLAVLVVAQMVFGLALGLIYYSSLFYSMDVGETKGEHGGIHEAAIGLGNLVGPAVGAAALRFVPQHPESGTVAVSALLLVGLGGLVTIWRKGEGVRNPKSEIRNPKEI